MCDSRHISRQHWCDPARISGRSIGHAERLIEHAVRHTFVADLHKRFLPPISFAIERGGLHRCCRRLGDSGLSGRSDSPTSAAARDLQRGRGRCRPRCMPPTGCCRTCAAGSRRSRPGACCRICARSPRRRRWRSATARRVLAFEGVGHDHHHAGDALLRVTAPAREDRLHVESPDRVRADRLPAGRGGRRAAAGRR